MAINFGKAFGPNAGLELSQAVGSAAENIPFQQAQRQAAGQQILAQYKAQAAADTANGGASTYANPAWIQKVTQISKLYGIPLPMMGSQGGMMDAVDSSPSGASGMAPPQPVQPGQAQAPATTGGAAAAQQGDTPSMPFGAPSGGAPSMPAGQYQDPRLKMRGQAYDALLQKAAADPNNLRDPSFHSQIVHAAGAVGRNPDQMKADIHAYIQKAKQGAAQGAQPGTPAQGAQGTPPAQGAPQQAQPTGTPPEGQTSFMRPASEGPTRINLNAWLGRTMGSQDFNMYSQMTPENRVEALKQGGWDPHDFSPAWLKSEPTLDINHQLALASDVSKQIGEGFKEGDSLDQIKTRIAPFLKMMTPDQVASINETANDDMNQALQIRLAQVQQSGYLRQQTIDLMGRRLKDNEQNTTWDHNFKYQVFNEKTAEFSQRLQVMRQNANTSYQRLQNEIQQGTQPKMGELVTTARGLLTSINTAVNEYNTRVTAAIQAGAIDPKRGGVNPLMEQNIQNDIDAYNNIVTMMKGKGFNSFNYYQGADQSAMDANTARLTAGTAANAQGLATPGGSPPFTVPKGYTAKQQGGKWGVVDSKGLWYPWQGQGSP